MCATNKWNHPVLALTSSHLGMTIQIQRTWRIQALSLHHPFTHRAAPGVCRGHMWQLVSGSRGFTHNHEIAGSEGHNSQAGTNTLHQITTPQGEGRRGGEELLQHTEINIYKQSCCDITGLCEQWTGQCFTLNTINETSLCSIRYRRDNSGEEKSSTNQHCIVRMGTEYGYDHVLIANEEAVRKPV